MLWPRLHDITDIRGEHDRLIGAAANAVRADGDERRVLDFNHDLFDRRDEIGQPIFILAQDRGEKLDQRLARDARSLVFPRPIGKDFHTDVARLAAELPQALLAATMEGVPTQCSRVLLADEARALTPVIQSVFALPIEALPAPAPTLDLSINLVPDSWRNAAQQQVRTRRTRGQLQFAAVLYVLLAAGAATYFILLQRQAKELSARFAAVRPQLELVQTRQARSATLAPAIEPGRFTVELLYLLQRALPAAEVRITEFDQQPAEWRVTGEAPNAGLAIDYVNRLKADPDLASFQINSSPPQLLPNESARFSIFGTR